MRLGDTLNGYTITSEPTNVGGGMSQWAFAEKDGGSYFVKMFLAPKYPLPHAPGGAEAKARKVAVCLAFEQRHLEIANRLDPSVQGAGNLVVPVDFFRVDATYVKVMERVSATPLPDAHDLIGHQILVILRTLVFSLRLLHDQDIVHGDIKPDNVLVEQTPQGLFISKLIDFDEAYLSGAPPAPAEIVGDPSYYPPELLRYIKQDPEIRPDDLTTAADMFSFGLLFHRFLVGDHPDFDRTWAAYPCEVLAAGEQLDWSRAPEVAHELLARLLAPTPSDRPTIHDVVDFLRDVDGDRLVPAEAARPRVLASRLRSYPVTSEPAAAPAPAPPPGRPAGLHSTLGSFAPPSAPDPAPAAGGAPAGGPPLRSTMGRKRPGDPAETAETAETADPATEESA